MSNIAIRVEHIAKDYVIGAELQNETTVLDSIRRGVSSLTQAFSSEGQKHRRVWALRDISFELRHGEAAGIIGRNGAGKSTLLKILSRITRPSKGRVERHGRMGSLLEVGTGFHPELTGRDNIFLNGAILGMKRAEIFSKFDAIVDFSGINQYLDTPVKRYSSGMYTRLAFSVAAHLDPDILMVDEVLAVGDAAFQKRCLGKMGEIAREGRTILFVSHNMGIMQTLCSRGLVIGDGQVAYDGGMDKAAAFYLRQLEEASSEALDSRTDRNGKGDIRLTQISIRSAGGPNCQLMTGSPAEFSFWFSAIPSHCTLGMTIYDDIGAPITHVNSAYHAPHDLTDSSANVFACTMDELLLLPGRYRIAVALHASGELQDHLAAAAFFDVSTGSISGRMPPQQESYGRVAIPHRWTVPV